MCFPLSRCIFFDILPYMANQNDFRATDPLVEALKKVVPVTNLPGDCDSYQDLADKLTLALAGKVKFVPESEHRSLLRARTWGRDPSGRWA